MLADGRGGFVVVSIIGLVMISGATGAYLTSSLSPTNPYPPYIAAKADAGAAEVQRAREKRPCEAMVSRDDADLCAQWRAASAAEHGAFWSLAQLVLSAVGLLGLFVTLLYNRRALDLAHSGQTEASKIGQAQVRCYIDIGKVFLNVSKDGIPSVELTLKNVGQSPARKVSVHTSVRYSVLTRNIDQTYNCFEERNLLSIASNKNVSMSAHPCERGIEANIYKERDAGHTIGSWVIVVVKYVDVFGRRFRLRRVFTGINVIDKGSKCRMLRADEADAMLNAEVARRKHLGTWQEAEVTA